MPLLTLHASFILDNDDDGDGIPDKHEDADGDGIPDHLGT